MKKLRGLFVLVFLVGALVISLSTVIHGGTKLSYADWGDPMGSPQVIALSNYSDSFKTIPEAQAL